MRKLFPPGVSRMTDLADAMRDTRIERQIAKSSMNRLDEYTSLLRETTIVLQRCSHARCSELGKRIKKVLEDNGDLNND